MSVIYRNLTLLTFGFLGILGISGNSYAASAQALSKSNTTSTVGQLAASQATIALQISQIQILEGQLSDARSQLSIAQSTISSQRSQIQSLGEELSVAHSQVSALQSQLSSAQSMIALQSSQLQAAQNRLVDQIASDLEALNAAVAHQIQIGTLALQAQMEQHIAQLNAAVAAQKEADAQILAQQIQIHQEALAHQIELGEETINACQAEKQVFANQTASLTTQLAEAHATISSLNELLANGGGGSSGGGSTPPSGSLPRYDNIVGFWTLRGTGDLKSLDPIPALIGPEGQAYSQNQNIAYITESGKPAGISFDGINDYITLPATLSNRISTQVTVAAWVNARTTVGSDFQSIFSDGYGPFGDDTVLIELFISSGYLYSGFHPGNWIGIHGQDRFPIAEWHHVATTYDGSNQILYMDGNVVKMATLGSPLPYGGPAGYLIGRRHDFGGSGQAWNGYIRDVGLWNVALSASEIRELMNFSP